MGGRTPIKADDFDLLNCPRVDLGINNQLIDVKCSVPYIDIYNIHTSGWPLLTEEIVFVVKICESIGNDSMCFNVYKECFEGYCNCEFILDESTITLKPCRVFCECFMWGVIDPNWAYMLEGSVFGYRVVNPVCPCTYETENYNSILKPSRKEFMMKKLSEEIKLGKIIKVDKKPTCIHALGAVVKKKDLMDKAESIRPITDCSRSGDGSLSVNKYTDQVSSPFVYKSLDDVCDMLTEGASMMTADIADAYRSLHIYYGDRKYQGLRWDFNDGTGENLFIDARLCFGMSSGPFVFNCISEFIVRSMARRGFFNVVNYLDDFFVVYPSRSQCITAQLALFRVIRHLGFNLSFKKLSPVSTKVIFLGIEVDSVEMKLTLPDEKMAALLFKLKEADGKLKMSKRELQSLAGSLAHASKVVRGGRCFTRRIYNLCNKVDKQHHKIRLSGEARADIQWWINFAKTFNGSAKVLRPLGSHIGVYSDSSFSGFAAYHSGDWLMGKWVDGGRCPLPPAASHHWVRSPDSYNENINELEFWPVLLAAKRWGHLWADSEVTFVTDNTQVMHMLNTGRSSNSLCMTWVRELFWLAVTLNFYFRSVYINTKDNVICDALSRWGEKSARTKLLYATSDRSLCCHSVI